MSLPELVSTTIDNNPNTHFYYPQSLGQCVMKVFAGEYDYRSMPDEPRIRRVLDIGGNVGAFAAWIYRRLERPWIESYEPHPGAAEVYEKNAPPGAIVHRKAVSMTPGRAKLHVGVDWGQNSLMAGASVLTGEAIEVDTVSPADLPPCDLLKIDAEGVELEILENYPHLDQVQVLMFEWHFKRDRLLIEVLCENSGLTLVKSVHDRPDLGLQVWVRTRAVYNINENRYRVPE